MLKKDEKNFYWEMMEDWAKPYQQSDAKEAKIFGSKLWERKDHNEKAELINMGTEFWMIKVATEVQIHTDSLKITLKNIKLENPRPWWHTWMLV